MTKKLYKSTENKVLDGVCAGIAEYFEIDPTLVRLGWVVLTLAGGSGILAYIVCALVIPRKPEQKIEDATEKTEETPEKTEE